MYLACTVITEISLVEKLNSLNFNVYQAFFIILRSRELPSFASLSRCRLEISDRRFFSFQPITIIRIIATCGKYNSRYNKCTLESVSPSCVRIIARLEKHKSECLLLFYPNQTTRVYFQSLKGSFAMQATNTGNLSRILIESVHCLLTGKIPQNRISCFSCYPGAHVINERDDQHRLWFVICSHPYPLKFRNARRVNTYSP